MSGTIGAAPRVVLGMTLYNNAAFLERAAASLLQQTYGDFALTMLDDGSQDRTEPLARELGARDSRIVYRRHEARQGMVPTWKEVFEIATSQHPQAEYFAWVSDHDVWAPEWLETLLAELDAHPDAVMAYPQTPRIDEQDVVVDKTPRVFETAGMADVAVRWRKFCWEGFGSGDMVYGLARVSAVRRAGVFRPVMNPDRLLIAELTLQGPIHQVQKPLWLRRQSAEGSVARQRATLFAGQPPPGFGLPPAIQHVRWLKAQYGRALPPAPHVDARMRGLYLLSSAWRGFRKTETSKSLGRGVDNAHFVKKLAKKAVRVTIYYVLVTGHTVAAKLRRFGRHAVYHAAVLTHRLGLRSPKNAGSARSMGSSSDAQSARRARNESGTR